MAFKRQRDRRPYEDRTPKAEWAPRTDLGRKALAGEVTSLSDVMLAGTKILEPEIIDHLVPDLREEVLEVTSTQRMTAYGRKQQMRAVAVLGNGAGVVGAGIGKALETRDAISEAVKDAKKHLVMVQLGCSSWECGCGTGHSVIRECTGQNSSTQITVKPAPRGVGLVANETAKKVLTLAGVKDAWTFSKGRTRNVLNMVLATIHALDSLNSLKQGTNSEEEAAAPEAQEAAATTA
ncbi:30S ribosomal protein S5 [Candidatus Micrarchaeota archaeon]|nr:30S ribosomal protein S5 [Candidatus Micrarchaeota archaeon]